MCMFFSRRNCDKQNLCISEEEVSSMLIAGSGVGIGPIGTPTPPSWRDTASHCDMIADHCIGC